MDADSFENLYPEEETGSDFSFGYEPQRMTDEQFKQRNDPEPLLKRIRLMLMNAYAVEEVIHNEDGTKEKKIRIKQKKNTNPKANKEGVEGILRYIEFIVNNHTVQGNVTSDADLQAKMRYISQDITIHFMTKRVDWGVGIRDIDELIATTVHLVDLFLSRTLNNEERRSYGESFKEDRRIEQKAGDKSGSWLENTAGFLKKRNWV